MIKNQICTMVALLPIFFAPSGGPASVWERSWAEQTRNPLTNRVAFVVDTSGSMRGEPLAVAHDEVGKIMSFAADGTWVKVYAFSDGVTGHQTPILDEEGNAVSVPEEWIQLPSQEATDRVDEWLHLRGSGGNTNLALGVIQALSDPEPDLTVVVITDGEVTGPEDAHLDGIEEAQKRRCRPAVIHVIGVQETRNDASLDFMRELARRNQGGALLWRKRTIPAPEAH